jgi:integrase
VDFKAGFIRLRAADTKTKEARHLPIGRELREVPQGLPIALDPQGARVPYVFTRQGQPIRSIREIFNRVCRGAGLADVVFHDLRHMATTNLRRAGADALTAMKSTGHKTMAVFKRYNTIGEDDLTTAQCQMHTYMDTKGGGRQRKHSETLEK